MSDAAAAIVFSVLCLSSLFLKPVLRERPLNLTNFEGRRKATESNKACYSSFTLHHAYRLLVVLVTTDEAATVDSIERILQFAPENLLEQSLIDLLIESDNIIYHHGLDSTLSLSNPRHQ